MRPLLKWAGGKTRLLPEILRRVPKFGRYFEPFLGGGAVFGALCPPGSVLSDSNVDLITFYETVRESPSALNDILAGWTPDRECYGKIRAWDRDPDFPKDRGEVELAARFYYINKTGYNGLWRVNPHGQCSVPFGSPNWATLTLPPFTAQWSEILKTCRLEFYPFDEVLDDAEVGDFTYLDPPYLGTFSGYTRSGFDENDHIHLKKYCDKLSRRDVKFLLSLSDVPKMRELYEKYIVETVNVTHCIGPKAAQRPRKTELLVRNYEL